MARNHLYFAVDIGVIRRVACWHRSRGIVVEDRTRTVGVSFSPCGWISTNLVELTAD